MRKLKIKTKHQVITSHFPSNCVQSCQLPNRLLKPKATLGERGGMCWPVDGIYKGLLSGDWLPQLRGASISAIGKGSVSGKTQQETTGFVCVTDFSFLSL